MTQDSSNITPRKWQPKESWTAPEHKSEARSMRRDYPRDDLGNKIPGKGKELQVDKRPTVMIQPRPTYTIS